MLRNFVIDSGTSLGASANGSAVSVDKNYGGFAIACVISSASSLNGTLKLQASLDAVTDSSLIASTSWADVPDSTVTVTTDGVTLYDVSDKNWKWVRVVYTRTGGSGSLTTTFNENQ